MNKIVIHSEWNCKTLRHPKRPENSSSFTLCARGTDRRPGRRRAAWDWPACGRIVAGERPPPPWSVLRASDAEAPAPRARPGGRDAGELESRLAGSSVARPVPHSLRSDSGHLPGRREASARCAHRRAVAEGWRCARPSSRPARSALTGGRRNHGPPAPTRARLGLAGTSHTTSPDAPVLPTGQRPHRSFPNK